MDCIKDNHLFIELNFSDCNLTDKTGTHLSGIIKQQTHYSIDGLWFNQLRGGSYARPVSQGLCAIEMHGNHISDATIHKLCSVLMNDEWVRGICFRNNDITNRTTESIVSLVKSNRSLLAFDLKGNHIDPTTLSLLEKSCDENRKKMPNDIHPRVLATLRRWGYLVYIIIIYYY